MSLASCAIEPVLTDLSDLGAAPGEDNAGTTAEPVELCGNGVLDPGEGCDDGNPLVGDGCLPNCVIGGPLAAVWSDASPRWANSMAVGGGALVIGGAEYDGPARLASRPLTAGGPAAWSHSGPAKRRYDALAIALDGTIVAAAKDWSVIPAQLWLGRFAPTGELLAAHAYPAVNSSPQHVRIAPNGDIVALVGSYPYPGQVAVFDAAGALRFVHSPPPDPDTERVYSGLALDAQGRIILVGTHNFDYQVRHLILEALTPDGAIVWQRELESPQHVDRPAVVVTTDHQLLVATGKRVAGDWDDFEIAALAGFDADGALQWWRDDPTIEAYTVSPGDLVALPGGGAFIAWHLGHDDSASARLSHHDATGAQVYAVSPREDFVLDLDLGPDGLVYSLEVEEWDDVAQVIPYQP